MQENQVVQPKIKSIREIREEQARLIAQNPFLLVEEKYLTIKLKGGGFGKLILNSVQKKFLNVVKEKFFKGEPIRMIILKARQVGISTLIEAIIYAFTSRMKAVTASVIADDLDGANYLFSMQKTFQEYLDDTYKPLIERSNEKKLAFHKLGSEIFIDTAENTNIGRKYTLQFVHLSEAAFYRKSLNNILLGINQAIPQLSGTMEFIESTANGISNDFYDLWQAAKASKNDYIPFFIGWNEVLEYSRLLVSDKLYPIDGIKFINSKECEKFIKDESELEKRYNLSREQINWRRWTIVNNCNGNLLKFRQEFPITPEEGFLATGDIYFDRDGCLKQEKKKPNRIGNFVLYENKIVFRESLLSGLWKIYEDKSDNRVYCIGADPAEGLPHGDYSAAVVIDKLTGNTIATYRHKSAPDVFAVDLVDAAKFYNNCMIACENKGYGSAVNRDMYKMYGNLFRMIKSKDGKDNITGDLGWNTNASTRRIMLAQLAEEIREGVINLYDEDLILELWTFICNPERRGEPEADSGKTDDLIIARCIASMVMVYYPYVKPHKSDMMRQNRELLPNQGYSFKS